jgi:Zn-dependent protease with chaperone function
MALEWIFLLLLVGVAGLSAYGIYWVFTVWDWHLWRVKIFVSLALGAVVLAVIPCFFVFRQRYRPFGLEVRRGTHPRLWEEIERVAKDLGAKPPDIIFLNHEVNASVFEVVGFLGLRKRRVMVIGLGALSAVTIPEFRATIAHELAHYTGGHTAFNGWLIRTSQRLELLDDEEKPLVLGILVRVYLWVFVPFVAWLRRREEYYADEVAARYVGRSVAMRSLRSVAIAAYLQAHFAEHGGMNAIHDGVNYFAAFRMYMDSARQQGKFPEIERRVGQIPPTPYDLHPTYAERIAFARRLPDKPEEPDRRLARELLDDAERVEEDLTKWMKTLLDLSWRDKRVS